MSAPGSSGFNMSDGMESLGIAVDGDADRFDIAGRAGDQHCAGDAVVVELDDPAVGQVFARFRNLPAKRLANFGGRVMPSFCSATA